MGRALARMVGIGLLSLLCACASKSKTTTPDAPLTPKQFSGSLSSERTARYIKMYRMYEKSEQRVHAAEDKLAAAEAKLVQAEKELAELRSQVDDLRAQQAKSSIAAAVRPVALPPGPAPGEIPAPPEEAARLNKEIADKNELIAALRDELEDERARRDRLQDEIAAIRAETSVGPFERGGPSQALKRAQGEIRELKSALEREQQARLQIEREFAELQRKASAAPVTSSVNETLLKQQEEVIASLRRDLEISRANERDLQQEIEKMQGGSNETTMTVTRLVTENENLRAQLKETQELNERMAAKLKVAARVTDLIFRAEEQENRE